ncbi:MAG TPA: hypothetical protein PKL83_00785 [bacterium]|nr:hypothetical protein [bacterium]
MSKSTSLGTKALSQRRDRITRWEVLHMAEADWWKLALAFYDLAHGDLHRFEKLPKRLRKHDIGQLCRCYVETQDYAYCDEAGRQLTGTDAWYVYLGRCM